MFALVADVARYPEFLPWCVGAKLGAREDIDGRVIQMADLTVAFAHIRETYTSRVTMDPETKRVAAQHVQGPFQHLDTLWVFTPKGEGACIADCTVDFAFKSRSMQAVMSMVFGSAVAKMTSAFEARARVLYGAKARTPV